MKTKAFKRVLSAVLTLVMFLGCVSVAMVTTAASNITIAGVDIGYAHGDYFSKNGNACGSCHGKGICVANGSNCNCRKAGGAVQCKGYAYHCQLKVYGCTDASDSSKFNNLGSLSKSNCTAANLKNLLKGCSPATHLRTGDGGHSVVIISADDSGVKTTSCNYDSKCGIRVKDYTWTDFASYLKNRSGVSYAYSAKNPPSSTQPTQPSQPSQPSQPTEPSQPSNPSSGGSFFDAIINFFKMLFSIFSIF